MSPYRRNRNMFHRTTVRSAHHQLLLDGEGPMLRKTLAIGSAALALLAPTALASAAHAQAAPGWAVPPPPDKIVIDVVTVNGSGCRPGTAAVAVSPDNTAFTVTYSEY